MELETALQSAETLLQPLAVEIKRPEPERVDVYITLENLKPAVQTLVDAHWGYLAAITGVDKPAPAVAGAAPDGDVEVLYTFANGGALATLRVRAPYTDAQIPTICDIIPAATLFERELIEMLGVDCIGTPDRGHLILPDEWPEGVYPLRKSFTGLNQE
ncbi:MAG TPA: NADH-quinone oxidoreductase subunit C [Anaerolineaceae bacterium]|jgi:Ni,Fe-hydrogenase III component G|nr:NADH-quinone oxidoreductase subunit C [Anaerolineaceae bacterium]